MGMSAGASLVFGVDLGAYEEWPYDPETYETIPPFPYDVGEVELDEYIATEDGHTNPWTLNPYSDDTYGDRYEQWKTEHPEWEAIKDAWYETKRQIEAVIPVEVLHYGYHEYPRYALILKDSRTWAYDYGSESVNVAKMWAITRNWQRIETAAKFCREYSLPEFKNPSWILVADYG